MRLKTKLLAERFVEIISKWDTVECIELNEAALSDTLDPYFAVILDVYYCGEIMEPMDRRAAYGEGIAAFESSSLGNKDRFLVGSLPVRLEFKSIDKVEEIVDIADKRTDQLWLIKDSGTYGFYRLARGEVLYKKNAWIDEIRSRLSQLGDEFWHQMRAAHQSKMEHFLSDLGAALMQGDDFHYLISSAGFIKNACVALFCINKRFEPSHRGYYEQVKELSILPDEFVGRFESFLRNEAEMTVERKYSLAQLIARSVLAL